MAAFATDFSCGGRLICRKRQGGTERLVHYVIRSPISQEPMVYITVSEEASGLDECFRHLGVTVRIPQSARVDSLNLSAAVVIGAYAFTLDEPE